jgi:hypothetical protein
MWSRCHSITPLIPARSVLDSEDWTTSDHQMQARIQRSQRSPHHIERIAGPANIPEKIKSRGLFRFDVDAPELTAIRCRTANIKHGTTRRRPFASCVFRASLWMVLRQPPVGESLRNSQQARVDGRTYEADSRVRPASSHVAPDFGEAWLRLAIRLIDRRTLMSC